MTLSIADIEQRLKGYAPPARENGDYALNPGMTKKKRDDELRDAAVLILLVPKEDGSLSILFTERTKTLHAHAGQISFPGGGVDKDDKDNRATALREAAEEIGLNISGARVIGELEDYVTRTGFRVKPVVAVLEKDQVWTPNPGEVAKIFEVPLDFILTSGNLAEESLTFEGGERRFYAVTYDGNHIWGATAGMLKDFSDAIAGPPPSDKTVSPARKNDAPPKSAL
ncbi:MAG: CoA pyrophosphatase [Alphaproteobacteria bacterium]|nr:MAG: CoA pyrophosphatase [Alphaproteobacteria bacterium]